MPYVTASDFARVRDLIDLRCAADDASLRQMEKRIFELNRQIRNCHGGVTPEWQALIATHEKMMTAYRRAGGRQL